MSSANAVLTVTDASFQKDVIERSQQTPVVVDFWAPWCGPCRMIGPVLERLAAEAANSWVLAKVNSDENPGLSRTFQVTSIPAVMAFHRGKVVSGFVGAQPESAIRKFLDEILPSKCQTLSQEGETKRKGGRFEEAEALFDQALQGDRGCASALLGLARLRADQGRSTDAMELLDRVPPGTAERAEAERLAAHLRVQAGASSDPLGLKQRVIDSPDDLEARNALGLALAAAGNYDEALAQFLEIVRRDRGARGEAARKAMLDIFQILGSDNPLTLRFRGELAGVLFA